ncbi:hypothetical protein [Cryptosporangium phraense]|uniref:Uncharacterized protein n=1 Tax=Cryptosporangium phraense TaxID=2593070 RepID=A0A545AML3_9ACTN|nr:hypothetical protein [Cryptosporangium phraense]TQS41975.1 hypothetical protein FL583_27230 [Cryptosporangium phraense]
MPARYTDAQQTVDAARTALLSTAGVRVVGVEEYRGRRIDADYRFGPHECQAFGRMEAGGWEVRRVDGSTFVRVDAGMLVANGLQDRAAELVGGRWLQVTALVPKLPGADAVTLDGLLRTLPFDALRGGRVVPVAFRGEATAMVVASSGASMLVHVGTDPYPIRIVVPAAGTSYEFRSYGEAPHVVAPADAFDVTGFHDVDGN